MWSFDWNVIKQCMALHQTIRSPSVRIQRVHYCMHETWLSAVMTGGRVWRLINRNRIQIRVERAYRGSSHTLPLNVNYPKQEDMYFPSPTGRCFSTTAAGKRGIFSSPGNHSANERLFQLSQWKATTFQTPSFLQWTLCLQQPLWTAPSLYKRKFLSFVLWTWHGLPLDWMCPTAIFRCSQINPFRWRNIGCPFV